MSDSLWPHGLQNARLPCPSLSLRVCSNLCPLSRWCHPTTSSSATLFSFCLQSSPASEFLPMSQLFPSGNQSIGVSASKSVLPMNGLIIFRTDWFDLHTVQGTLRSLLQHTVWKHQFFRTQPSLWPNSHIHTWLLPSQSLLCSPHNRPMNPRDKVLKQGRDFNWGVSRPRRW